MLFYSKEKKYKYCSKTGILWMKNHYTKKYKCVKTPHSKGYLTCSVNKKTTYIHRFVWELCYGKIPKGMQIDHINHDKKDNRLINLRLVTNEENHKNMPLRKNNKSGIAGVHYSKRDKIWVAQGKENGKTINLGFSHDKKLASKYREDYEIKNNFYKKRHKEML